MNPDEFYPCAGVYILKNVATGTVLDLYYGHGHEGTPITGYELHGGDNQKWRLERLGTDSTVSLRNVSSGTYLSFKDFRPGVAVTGSAIPQSWNISAVDKGYSLEPTSHHGYVLDLTASDPKNQTPVILYPNYYTDNQKWILLVSPTGTSPPGILPAPAIGHGPSLIHNSSSNGLFSTTAKYDSLCLQEGHILRAILKRVDGQWNATSFDLNLCLGNVDGQFTWGRQAFSLAATDVRLDLSKAPAQILLRANLPKPLGLHKESSIDLNQWIANINGELRYQGPLGITGIDMVAEVLLQGNRPVGPELLTGEFIPQNDRGSAAELLVSSPFNAHGSVRCIVQLCFCIPRFPPHLPHGPLSEIPHTARQVKDPAPDPSLPPEQASGKITCLPPNDDLCKAFAAKFTEPRGRELRFTAQTSIAITTFFCDQATLHCNTISEATGTRSFSGLLSKRKVLINLDNGVKIVGEVTRGGPDMEIEIAGSGHWGLSR